MPAQCNIPNCKKNASLAGPGLAEYPLICGERGCGPHSQRTKRGPPHHAALQGDDEWRRPRPRRGLSEHLYLGTTQKVPNHIEDDIYHQGGIGEPAAVTFSIAIKALDSVRKGPFFFNTNVPSFFIRRMKKHYEWARDPDKWLIEGTDSRLRRLEYKRQRVEAKQAEKDDNNNKKAKTA